MKTLVDAVKSAGAHQVTWDGKNQYNNQVSTGIYFYVLEAGPVKISKKMVLVK
ncbi:MAG: hypothetical protein Kow00108_18040 [Calditrichia bacterium]